jgi:hypothetical protein
VNDVVFFNFLWIYIVKSRTLLFRWISQIDVASINFPLQCFFLLFFFLLHLLYDSIQIRSDFIEWSLLFVSLVLYILHNQYFILYFIIEHIYHATIPNLILILTCLLYFNHSSELIRHILHYLIQPITQIWVFLFTLVVL